MWTLIASCIRWDSIMLCFLLVISPFSKYKLVSYILVNVILCAATFECTPNALICAWVGLINEEPPLCRQNLQILFDLILTVLTDCTVLYCTVLTVLYCTVLTVLYCTDCTDWLTDCTVLYCTVLTDWLYCTVLYCTDWLTDWLYCTVLTDWLYCTVLTDCTVLVPVWVTEPWVKIPNRIFLHKFLLGCNSLWVRECERERECVCVCVCVQFSA